MTARMPVQPSGQHEETIIRLRLVGCPDETRAKAVTK